MSADKYPRIFPRQMEAIVYIFSRQMEAVIYVSLLRFAKKIEVKRI